MIATPNQQSHNTRFLDPSSETVTIHNNHDVIKPLNPPSSLLLPSHHIVHTPKAGLNAIVDTASYLFSVIGELKQLQSYRRLKKLQSDLIREINHFQKAIIHHGYNVEYVAICRYIICATFDDIITHSSWGAGQWEHYSLLATYNQDLQHQHKFFAILERTIQDPTLYIDLMEFMYICLSMGYKGQYRGSEYNQYQLEQIINNLYKHIQAHRGSFSKILSPMPFKSHQNMAHLYARKKWSLSFVLILTASIIMAIFISLGYLMEAISNESFKNITQIENSISHPTFE
ncbi:MAG: type IVB secretion system protein IcmH/DotU [Gammaproteobacteria bacterium]|nr:type IVB secretion system protein IcmH/DotU [Gammaproteobacteria bacterium]